MSARAIAWASGVHGKTIAQKEVLMALAELADDDGLVRGAYKALEKLPSSMTPLQVRKAAEALVLTQLAAQQWNPDKYVWDIRLGVPA